MSIFDAVPTKDKISFIKNFSIMLKSGVSLSESLASSARQAKNPTLKTSLQKITKDVVSGTSLTQAFQKEQKVFDPIFTTLIKAGEASGQLEENLTFIGVWMERNFDLKKDIGAATLYPKIVLTAAILIAGGLTLFILPQLITLFEGLKVELPLATRILMAISRFSQAYWPFIIIGVIGSVVAFIFLNRITSVKRFLQNFYLRVPFIGGMLRDYEIALLAQLLSTLLKSGMSISENLAIVKDTTTSIPYRESLTVLQRRVLKGIKLSAGMRSYPNLYPDNFVDIVAAGEKSGSLEESLGYMNDFYAKEVKDKAKKLPTVLEPILLIFIAGIVGFIAIAIITPIYKITGTMNN